MPTPIKQGGETYDGYGQEGSDWGTVAGNASQLTVLCIPNVNFPPETSIKLSYLNKEPHNGF